jgi:hypothetical protein
LGKVDSSPPLSPDHPGANSSQSTHTQAHKSAVADNYPHLRCSNMFKKYFCTAPPKSLTGQLCENIQKNLILKRNEGFVPCSELPRATKIDGRYTLTEEHFPEYVDKNSLSDVLRWKTTADTKECYTQEYLETHLPVSTPDKAQLDNGPPTYSPFQ